MPGRRGLSARLLAVLMAASILGGTRRLTDVTGYMVPIMAIIYLGVGAVVIAVNYQNIPAMFSAISTAPSTSTLSSAVSRDRP